MTYGIEVGRWTGMFFFLHYSDIFISDSGISKPYHSFTAFTKKGALKKATRYVKRISHSEESNEVYSYDVLNQELKRIS